MHAHRPVKLALGWLFLVAFMVSMLTMSRDVILFDDGIILANSLAVYAGLVPHRDFYSIYGPLQYYLLGGLFDLFGTSFLIARLYSGLIIAGITAVFYYMLSPVQNVLRWAYTGLCFLWLYSTGFYLYPVYPCILLALIGTILLIRTHHDGKLSWLLGAGMSSGVIALFRYDVGFVACVIHALTLAVLTARKPAGMASFSVTATRIFIYAAGVAIVFMPAAILYLANAPVSGFKADIIDYPTQYYAAMRGLPFPNLEALRADKGELGVYFPLVALAAALLVTITTRTRRTPDTKTDVGGDDALVVLMITSGLLACGFYYKGIVRVSTLHMLISIIPALLLSATLVSLLWKKGVTGKLLAAALMLFTSFPPAWKAGGQFKSSWAKGLPATWILDKSRTSGGASWQAGCDAQAASTFAGTEIAYRKVGNYLRTNSASDEKVFVGTGRHDKIFVNPVALYYLAERLPGTHWHQFDPGLQNRPDIQEAMISDLIGNKVRWVVRDAHFDEVAEPNESSKSSEVYLLDRFLEANYRPVATSGKLSIWLLNSVPAPAPPAEKSACLPDSVV